MHISVGLLFGGMTFILWGIADYFAAVLSRKYGVRTILITVQLAGLVLAFLFGALYFKQEVWLYFSFKFIWQTALIGIIFAAGYIVFYKGLAEGLVAVVSPISACWSLITVVWGCFVFHEILSAHKYAGIAFILLGVLLTSMELKNIFKLNQAQLARGAFEGVLAMILWGVSFTLIIPLSREYGWYYPILWIRFWSFVVTGLFFCLFPKYLHKPNSQKLNWYLIVLVAICDIGGVFAFSEGSRVSLASVVAPIASCFPIITILMADYFLKERLSLSQKIGVGLSLCGIVLLSV